MSFPPAKTNISDEGDNRGDTVTTLVGSHDRSPMEWALREADNDHGGGTPPGVQCGGNPAGPALSASPSSIMVGDDRAQLSFTGTFSQAEGVTTTVKMGAETFTGSKVLVTGPTALQIELGDTNRFAPGVTPTWVEQSDGVKSQCFDFTWAPWTRPIHVDSFTPNRINTASSAALTVAVVGKGFTASTTFPWMSDAFTVEFIDDKHLNLHLANPTTLAATAVPPQPRAATLWENGVSSNQMWFYLDA